MNRKERRKLERFGVKAFSGLDIKKAEFILEVDGSPKLALTGPQDKIKSLLENKYPETMKEVKRQTDYDLSGNTTLKITSNIKGGFVAMTATIDKRICAYLTQEDLREMTTVR